LKQALLRPCIRISEIPQTGRVVYHGGGPGRARVSRLATNGVGLLGVA
jgi:hypothetical protein